MLEAGQKLTLITVQEFGRMTIKRLIRITEVGQGWLKYHVPGRKRDYLLEVDAGTMLFDSHTTGLQVESDHESYHGDGCFIFTGTDREATKQTIAIKQLNPLFRKYEIIKFINVDDLHMPLTYDPLLFSLEEAMRLNNM